MDRGVTADLTAEKAILGVIMLYPETLNEVFLHAEDFTLQLHRQVFEAIHKLSSDGVQPDTVAITSVMNGKATAGEISGLVDEYGLPGMVGYYCRCVRKCSTGRKLVAACQDIMLGLGEDNALDAAEAKIMEIREGSGAKDTAVIIRDTLGPVFKELELLNKRGSIITGIPTGFADLDKMTAGLQSSDLIIIAGRPSMGKTALAVNLLETAANTDKKSLVFSLEMSKEQLVKRLLSTVGKIDGQRIRTGQFTDGDWQRMTDASGKISNMPVWIDDGFNLGVMELRAKARRHKRQFGLDLLVIDYLQLMKVPKANSQALAVGEISRSLKALAKELKVPVVCLSQLNRSLESRTDKRPMMSDLRESGAIEQDADVIMFVYRDSVYCAECKAGMCKVPHHEKRAEVIIGKQRNGPTGTVQLVWSPEFTQFGSLDTFREG